MDISDDQIKRIAIIRAADLASQALETLTIRAAVLENLFGNPDTTVEALRAARERYEDALREFDLWAGAAEFGARELASDAFLDVGAGI